MHGCHDALSTSAERRIIPPLHEADGETAEDDELIGTPKSDSESSVPSLHGIGAIVRQELQTANWATGK